MDIDYDTMFLLYSIDSLGNTNPIAVSENRAMLASLGCWHHKIKELDKIKIQPILCITNIER